MSDNATACACGGTARRARARRLAPRWPTRSCFVTVRFKARLLASIGSTEIDGSRPLDGLGTRDDDDPTIALIDAVAGTLHVLAWNAARLFDDGSLRRTEDRDALRRPDAPARLRAAAGARGDDDARLHARQLRPGRAAASLDCSRSSAPSRRGDDPEGHEGRVDSRAAGEAADVRDRRRIWKRGWSGTELRPLQTRTPPTVNAATTTITREGHVDDGEARRPRAR